MPLSDLRYTPTREEAQRLAMLEALEKRRGFKLALTLEKVRQLREKISETHTKQS
jgi:hypothetical protein